MAGRIKSPPLVYREKMARNVRDKTWYQVMNHAGLQLATRNISLRARVSPAVSERRPVVFCLCLDPAEGAAELTEQFV